MIRIGVIGEYDPAHETHVATDDALGHSAMACSVGVEATWVSTSEVSAPEDVEPFDGLFVATGGPYRSLDGALCAIEHARTNGVPLLGTCAGLQHIILELARNVAGIADAQHAEYDPGASTLFVTPLSCSLRGQTMEVTVRPGTRAAAAYGSATAAERYYCDFGLNPDHLDDLLATGAVVSGTDGDGEVRIVELPDHPFLVGTLFVPQARSTLVRPHPIVTAFVAAAVAVQAGGQEDPEPGVTIIGE